MKPNHKTLARGKRRLPSINELIDGIEKRCGYFQRRDALKGPSSLVYISQHGGRIKSDIRKIRKLVNGITRKLGPIAIAVALVATANADDRRRSHTQERREHHNWIIERQTAGQVQGVPTSRRIRGGREIDIYPNGLMFEKGNVVGIEKR